MKTSYKVKSYQVKKKNGYAPLPAGRQVRRKYVLSAFYFITFNYFSFEYVTSCMVLFRNRYERNELGFVNPVKSFQIIICIITHMYYYQKKMADSIQVAVEI